VEPWDLVREPHLRESLPAIKLVSVAKSGEDEFTPFPSRRADIPHLANGKALD